ncbi:MAG: hypothetical protein KKD39_01900 [Candidatus Altiarchaeota archaeon]|nr:hypothetical protein [Candidatus Altiarchaeota archaeon]
MNTKILNSRERKKIMDGLALEYSLPHDAFHNLVFVKYGGDVWVATREVLSISLDISVDSVGLQLLRDGVPTVSALQTFFQGAEKTELTSVDAKKFVAGEIVSASGKVMAYHGHPLDLAKQEPGGVVRLRR